MAGGLFAGSDFIARNLKTEPFFIRTSASSDPSGIALTEAFATPSPESPPCRLPAANEAVAPMAGAGPHRRMAGRAGPCPDGGVRVIADPSQGAHERAQEPELGIVMDPDGPACEIVAKGQMSRVATIAYTYGDGMALPGF